LTNQWSAPMWGALWPVFCAHVYTDNKPSMRGA
jgi:hypothetical protein